MDRNNNKDESPFFRARLQDRKPSMANSDWGNGPEEQGYYDDHELNFFEKVLPGLNCFAELDGRTDLSMENELDQIDPWLLAGKENHEASPQQFFNFIERESDYEQLKNKKIDRTLELQFKNSFEQSYNSLQGSKIFEFINSSDLMNRIENFLSIEIDSPDRSESPLEKIKHDYHELLYRLKNKVADKAINKDKDIQILNPIVEYAFSVLRTILKAIKSFDEKRTAELMMKTAAMDKRRNLGPASITSLNKSEGAEQNKTTDSNHSQGKGQTFSQQQGSQGGNSSSGGGSKPQNSNRKLWSKEEERELLNLIRENYPGGVPADLVELYATKHQRSQISVKSKIQKIVSSHKDKLESELDNIFFKKHRQQQPGPVSVIPTTITTPIKENEDLTQIKEFLGDYLRNNARLGIEQSELRSKVPKNVIDSHTLAKVVRELEQDRKVLVRQVPGLHLDPSRLHFFDREALEHVKKVLRKKYKTGLVEGIYPLDILFEGEETLKGKVALTEFTNIRLFTFIFYVD